MALMHIRREDVSSLIHPLGEVTACAVHPLVTVAYLGRSGDWDRQRRNLISFSQIDAPTYRAHADHPISFPPVAHRTALTSSVDAIAVHPNGRYLYMGLRVGGLVGGLKDLDQRGWEEPYPPGTPGLRERLQSEVFSWYELDERTGLPTGASGLHASRLSLSETSWVGRIASMAMHPDGHRLYAASRDDHVVAAIHLDDDGAPSLAADGAVLVTISKTYTDATQPTTPPLALTLRPNGSELYVSQTRPAAGKPHPVVAYPVKDGELGTPRPLGVSTATPPIAFVATEAGLHAASWPVSPATALSDAGRNPLGTAVFAVGATPNQPFDMDGKWDVPAPLEPPADITVAGGAIPQVGNRLLAGLGASTEVIVVSATRATDVGVPSLPVPVPSAGDVLDGTVVYGLSLDGPPVITEYGKFPGRRIEQLASSPATAARPDPLVAVLSRPIHPKARALLTAEITLFWTLNDWSPRTGSTLNMTCTIDEDGERAVKVPAAKPGVEQSLPLTAYDIRSSFPDVNIVVIGSTESTIDWIDVSVRVEADGKEFTPPEQTRARAMVKGRSAHFFVSPRTVAPESVGVTTTAERASRGLRIARAATLGSPVLGPTFVDVPPGEAPATLAISCYGLAGEGLDPHPNSGHPPDTTSLADIQALRDTVVHLGFNMINRYPSTSLTFAELDAIIGPNVPLRSGQLSGSGMGAAGVVWGDLVPASVDRAAKLLLVDFATSSLPGGPVPPVTFVEQDDLHYAVGAEKVDFLGSWGGVAAYTERFQHYLQGGEPLAAGLTATDFGARSPTDWGSVTPLLPTENPGEATGTGYTPHDAARRYWTLRFLSTQLTDWLVKWYKVLKAPGANGTWTSEEMGVADGRSWCGLRDAMVAVRIFNPGHWFRNDDGAALVGGEEGQHRWDIQPDQMTLVRQGTANPTSYIGTDEIGTPAAVAFVTSLLRSAARNGTPSADRAASPAARRPFQPECLAFAGLAYTDATQSYPDWNLYCALSTLGRGASAFIYYTLGPSWAHGNGFSENSDDLLSEKFSQAARINRLARGAQEFLLKGQVRIAKVAVLLPGSSDVWAPSNRQGAFGEQDSQDDGSFENRNLVWALSTAGVDVDLISEQDIELGALADRGYRVLYCTGRNITKNAQGAIDRWIAGADVPAGVARVVVFVMAAGSADEYDAPSTVIDELLGLDASRGRVPDHTPANYGGYAAHLRDLPWPMDPALRRLVVKDCATSTDLQTGSLHQIASALVPLVPDPTSRARVLAAVDARPDDRARWIGGATTPVNGTSIPVVTRRIHGSGGEAWAFGFLAATEFDRQSDRKADPSGTAHRYGDGYDDGLRALALWPLTAAGIKPQWVVPVDCTGTEVLLLTSKPEAGTGAVTVAATVLNWTPTTSRPMLVVFRAPPPGPVNVRLASGAPAWHAEIAGSLVVGFWIDSVDVVLIERAAPGSAISSIPDFLKGFELVTRDAGHDPAGMLKSAAARCDESVRDAILALIPPS